VPGHFARTEFGYEGDEIPKPPKQKKAKPAPKPKPPPKPKVKKKVKAKKPAHPPGRQDRVSGHKAPQRRATAFEEELIGELQNFVTRRIGGIANTLLSRFTDVMNQRDEEPDADDDDDGDEDSEELEALDEYELEDEEDDDTDEEDDDVDEDDDEVVENDADDYGAWDDFRR
jgi:ribonuclease E